MPMGTVAASGPARDASRDGVQNRIEIALLTRFRPFRDPPTTGRRSRSGSTNRLPLVMGAGFRPYPANRRTTLPSMRDTGFSYPPCDKLPQNVIDPVENTAPPSAVSK